MSNTREHIYNYINNDNQNNPIISMKVRSQPNPNRYNGSNRVIFRSLPNNNRRSEHNYSQYPSYTNNVFNSNSESRSRLQTPVAIDNNLQSRSPTPTVVLPDRVLDILRLREPNPLAIDMYNRLRQEYLRLPRGPFMAQSDDTYPLFNVPTKNDTPPGPSPPNGGSSVHKNVGKKEILGKNRVIYKMKGSNKEYVKSKGTFIPVSEYKKLKK
jgi:hypothetical protein